MSVVESESPIADHTTRTYAVSTSATALVISRALQFAFVHTL